MNTLHTDNNDDETGQRRRATSYQTIHRYTNLPARPTRYVMVVKIIST